MKRFIYIFFLLILLSCEKDGNNVHKGGLMQFSVLTPEMVSTKAEVTERGLISGTNTDHVYVYGMSSDGTSSIPVFASPGTARLEYNSTTDTWKPIQIEYKGYYQDGKYVEYIDYVDKTWDNTGKLYYRFYGYAFSGNANSGNGTSKNKLEINTETSGRQFTVEQPENVTWNAPVASGQSADGSGTVDYLLSYMVNIPPSNNYPLVKLQLEHAMAKVEVDVQIAHAMIGEIENISVQISGVKRGATMLCLQPKLDTDSGSNIWQVTLNEELDQATAKYKVNQIACSEANLGAGENLISTDMSFIAVPVARAEMEDYELVLTYNKKGVLTSTYEYRFALKDYSPKGWMSGHRVRYVLTVDNSIHLNGSIVDYQDVDYMEGVMLPDIQQPNNVIRK